MNRTLLPILLLAVTPLAFAQSHYDDRRGPAPENISYGYADVPVEVRKQWQGLLEYYLTQRPNLIGLVLIMDSRRPLLELDWQMIGWFAPSGRPIHCLLTKADKLTRQEQLKTLRDARAALGKAGLQDRVSVQMFSSLKKSGIEDVEKVVAGWLEIDAATSMYVTQE